MSIVLNQSFIELDKAVLHVISLVSFLWLWFSLSSLWWMRIRGLWKLPDGRDWLRGKLGLVLMGGAVFSKLLIQFSADFLHGCVSSLLFDLRPNYGSQDEDNDDLLQKVPCTYCHTQWPGPCSRPLRTHTSATDSWTLTGKSGSASCGVAAPFFWVMVCTRFCLCLPREYFGNLTWRPDSFENSDAGKDWRQEEKGTTEGEMVGWHDWFNGHEFV